MRDLVGSILFLSLKQKFDMGEVLNFHTLGYLIFLQVLIEIWKNKTKQNTHSKAITGTVAMYCIY